MKDPANELVQGLMSAFLEWDYAQKKISFQLTRTEVHVRVLIIQDLREFEISRVYSLREYFRLPSEGRSDYEHVTRLNLYEHGRTLLGEIRQALTVSGLRTPAWGQG